MLIHNHNFLRLLYSRIFSAFGDSIVFLVLLKWVEVHSKQFNEISIIYLASYLPAALLAIPISVWIEQRKLQRVMIGSNLIRMVLFLVFYLFIHYLPYYWAFIFLFIDGLFALFFFPSNQSLLPHLVKEKRLRLQANSAFEMTYLITKICSYALVTLAIHYSIELSHLLMICILLWGMSTFFVWKIRPFVINNQATNESSLHQLKEGVKYLTGQRFLFYILCFYAVFWVIESSIDLINVSYIHRTLQMGSEFIGILNSTYFLGSIISTILFPRFEKYIRWKPLFVTVLFTYILFYSLLLMKVELIALSFIYIGIGMTTGFFQLKLITYIQEYVVAKQYARVFGFYQWVLNISPIIGFIIIGLLIHLYGIKMSIYFSMSIFVLLFIVIQVFIPKKRGETI